MDTDILVSIIVPIYNMGDKIEKSIETIIHQDYQNTEIILIDDGSTDDTLEKCNRICQENKNVAVIHTENCGAGSARNKGIDVSKGRYLYFPDADDMLEKNAISSVVKAAAESGADLVVFGYKCIDQNGRFVKEKRYKDRIVYGKEARSDYSDYYLSEEGYRIQGAPWNKLFDGKKIRDNHISFPPLRRHQDEAFIARYMCYSEKVIFIDDVLYSYKLNMQRNEWEKYPTDYFNAVNGLFDERKKNILIWNKDDYCTHEMVYSEYIYFTIKALELSFCPKFKFNYKSRIKWMQKQLEGAEFKTITCPNSLHKYQRIVRWLIIHNIWRLAYGIMGLKVIIQGFIVSRNV